MAHAYIHIDEYTYTNKSNKYNTNDSSKKIDGRVTKTGREKKRKEWGG